MPGGAKILLHFFGYNYSPLVQKLHKCTVFMHLNVFQSKVSCNLWYIHLVLEENK